MTTQNQLAFVSPRDGFAGLLDDDHRTVELVTPVEWCGQSFSAGSYATRFPDTTVVEVADGDEAIACLNELQEALLALDFTLLLFDSEVSHGTRREIAIELDEMLAVQRCREYVLDVMLACPLPDDVELETTTDAAIGQRNVRSLVEVITGSQCRVRLAHSAWLALRNDALVKQTGVTKVHGALIRFGVFRKLVERGKTQADVTHLRAETVLDLADHCDPRIVNSLISEYSSSLPVGIQVFQGESPTGAADARDEYNDVDNPNSTSHPRRVRSTHELQRAQSQVDRIADLFGQGNDDIGNQFLNELVESQTHSTEDHSHIVKSLCNIATKCRIRGRHDVSSMCLNLALKFKTGIDAVLYIQIGNALRDVQEYDRALECYEIAKQLDHGDRSDAIRLEIIRISVAKGDYELAISQYEQIPDIGSQPKALSGVGTLYRKMGDLRAARDCYYRVLNLDSSFHAAYAGLAEAAKQSGHHHKAIERYNAMMQEFSDNMDEGSLKVYTLARAFLFRMTHQLGRAADLLKRLNSEYPMDGDVHLQLAKLHMLQGETARARHHFELARSRSLDRVNAQLYFMAIGQSEPYSKGAKSEVRSSDVFLPEDLGLVACVRALSAIHDDNYELAQSELEKGTCVDKLHSDFVEVLNFHAAARLDQTINYKSNQTICRIAKRGYPNLRRTVHAILHDDFEVANKEERQMCLLIA